jgi:arylsulfatase A-like enzyme
MDRQRKHRMSQLAAVFCALAAACDGSKEGAEPVNVLLISLDSTRRDLLSCYGRRPLHAPERATCPNLDRLADGGVVFEDAYTTTSWTLPSHVSMFTGLSGVEHAVDESVHSYDGAQPMLTEILRDNGFRTAGFYSGPFLAPAYGFGRGFERYEACYGPKLVNAARDARSRIRERDAAKARGDRQAYVQLYKAAEDAEKALQAESHRDISSGGVTDAVLDELGRLARDDAPFFVFAHYFDPHYDYTPPVEHDLFDPDYEGTVDGEDFFDSPRIAGPPTGPGARERRVDERDLERVLSLYEAELSWTDAQVGRILDRLEELGLAENTLVIVTSDHGDEFFEHGAIGHRRTLMEEVVRVPLIMRLPGVFPAGERVGGLVSIQDIPATVLGALWLPTEAAASSQDLVPMIQGVGGGPALPAVIARLVMSFPFSYPAPANAPVDAVPGRERHVLETFRQGPIKITRRRRWTEPMMRTGSPLDAAWAEETRRQRSTEELSWIDVEAHPDEAPEHTSTSFDDPRALEALGWFRKHYTQLVARRGESAFVEQDEGVQAMLRGLGYTASDEDGGAPTDALVLPPPGEDLFD